MRGVERRGRDSEDRNLTAQKGIGTSCWHDDHPCCPGEVGPALGCEESGQERGNQCGGSEGARRNKGDGSWPERAPRADQGGEGPGRQAPECEDHRAARGSPGSAVCASAWNLLVIRKSDAFLLEASSMF